MNVITNRHSRLCNFCVHQLCLEYALEYKSLQMVKLKKPLKLGNTGNTACLSQQAVHLQGGQEDENMPRDAQVKLAINF